MLGVDANTDSNICVPDLSFAKYISEIGLLDLEGFEIDVNVELVRFAFSLLELLALLGGVAFLPVRRESGVLVPSEDPISNFKQVHSKQSHRAEWNASKASFSVLVSSM